MRVAPPKTPQEIRDLMLSDVSLAEDRHLLAVLLGIGAAGRRRGRVRKSRSSLGLAVARPRTKSRRKVQYFEARWSLY